MLGTDVFCMTCNDSLMRSVTKNNQATNTAQPQSVNSTMAMNTVGDNIIPFKHLSSLLVENR